MDGSTRHAGRDLPDGWVVWSEDDGLVVCFRPDVFDGDVFPRPCLPTITVSKADVGTVGGREGWRVRLFVEADVPARDVEAVCIDYGEAVDYAVEVADEFASGGLDFRECYADDDVRAAYVDKLESLTRG
ncbi:MAG: DUF5820 family protein [Halobacteriales archaeon]